MVRLFVWIALYWLGCAGASSQEAKRPASLAELQQGLSNYVAQPGFEGALWGVKVVSLDSGKTLFEHNGRKLFSPASNSKLYTVAMALDRLGGEYRIRTSAYAATRPNRRGTLKGNLVLYGRGDPTINARLHGGDIFRALEPLVLALTNSGVRRIDGDLIADQSFFRGPEVGSGWAWDDLQYYYGAEISALTINDNTLLVTARPGEKLGLPCVLSVWLGTSYLTFSNRTQTAASDTSASIQFYRPPDGNLVYASGQMPLGTNVFTGDLTFHNPAGLFGVFFKEALQRHGVKVSGKVRTVNWLDPQAQPADCAGQIELGWMESLPLNEIAREIQKPSQNLYTDLLLAHVGEKCRSADDPPVMSSEDLGIRELNKFLSEAGIAPGEVLFEEGSGLSRNNLTTPNATVTLLSFMSRHRSATAYLEALPVAGVDGTLRNRLKGTAAAGNLRAKTGSLRWASSLSGYVTTAAGERLAFCFMLNRYHNPTGLPRAELDALAVQLAGLCARSED